MAGWTGLEVDQVVFITQEINVEWVTCCFFWIPSHRNIYKDCLQGYNNVRASSLMSVCLYVCPPTDHQIANHQRRSELKNAQYDKHDDGDNDCDNEWRRTTWWQKKVIVKSKNSIAKVVRIQKKRIEEKNGIEKRQCVHWIRKRQCFALHSPTRRCHQPHPSVARTVDQAL